MDMPTPVANQIISPPPGASLNAMLGFLDVAKSRQALQIGQQQLKTQTAGATVAAQSADENQAIAKIMVDPVGNGITDSDGKPTSNAYSIMAKIAPTSVSQRYGDLMDAAQKHVQFNTSLNNLNLSERQAITSPIALVAANPDSKPEDVSSAIDGVIANVQGTPLEGDYQRVADSYKNAMKMADTQSKGIAQTPGSERWRMIALRMNRAVLPPESVSGATGLATPAPGMQSLGNVNQPTATNRMTGGTTPVGQPFNVGLPPGFDVVVDPRTHNPILLNRQTGETRPMGGGYPGTTPRPGVAPTGFQAAPGAAQRPPQTANEMAPGIPKPFAPGQQEVTSATASGIGGRVQQAQLAANNTIQAQDALTRARSILDSPSAPDTGTMSNFKRSALNFLSSSGLDTGKADDMNSLVKNLSRYEASRAVSAGLGGTDAARDLSHNGNPSVTLDNKALKGIVTQSLATEKALSTYANIQSKAGNDVGKLTQNEATFRNIPNLIEGYEYGLARTPAEADAFLAKHGMTHAQMGVTRKQIKEFESR